LSNYPKPYHNDQSHIAAEFNLHEDHVSQLARLAYFKINSYKLSLVNAAFCKSRQELFSIIEGSLLHYIHPTDVLADQGFFESWLEN
jgi:hypothetical protein